MSIRLILAVCLHLCLMASVTAQSQIDSVLKEIEIDRWAGAVGKMTDKIENKIISRGERTLQYLQALEEKICRKRFFPDSQALRTEIVLIRNKYSSLQNILSDVDSLKANSSGSYLAHVDTIKTAFEFIYHLCPNCKIGETIQKLTALENRFQQLERVKRILKERKEQLKEQLVNLGLLKELKKFNKEVFYYSQMIKEWKRIVSDPQDFDKKAIWLLSKTNVFCEFMNRNSVLASLFNITSYQNEERNIQSLPGLQGRVQVNNVLHQRLFSEVTNDLSQFQDNIVDAQKQLHQLQNKIASHAKSSEEVVPENFLPNLLKTKTFFQRLEYGINLQSQKSSSFLPVTSDLAITVGYKINDRSIVGIAGSFKIGWGQSLRNIHLTNQGVAFRSFIDWKIKGSFSITGGYELNYKLGLINSFFSPDVDLLQPSGLLGLSKTINTRSGFFKKTNLQILLDFLSHRQIPQGKPILFRIGYNF